MTQHDFELIARVIKNLPTSARKVVALQFASELKCTNAGFNPDRFLKACGVEE